MNNLFIFVKSKNFRFNGLKLGWLINPQEQEVEIYRPNQIVEIIALPATLSGENILPNFTLNLPLY